MYHVVCKWKTNRLSEKGLLAGCADNIAPPPPWFDQVAVFF